MLWLCVTLCALAASGAAAPVISYISSPAGANETVVLAGGGFSDGCVVQLTSLSTNKVMKLGLVAGQTTESSVKFVLPADLPIDAFSVVVYDGTGASSSPVYLNAPEPWWCQGDAGDSATPGGWIRCFGMSISNVNGSVAVARQRLRYLRHEVLHRGGLDDPAGDNSLLAAVAKEILSLRAQLSSEAQPYSELLLTPDGWSGASVKLLAFPSNATQYSAEFAVPANIQTGLYALSISNGLGGVSVPLDSFVSPGEPHSRGLSILPYTPWPSAVFPVTNTTQPTRMPAPTSDDALQAAIAAASAAGGGTIQLSAGQFYLTRPIVLPPRTRLVGAGMELTGIYFAEDTPASAPYAYFSLAAGGPVESPRTSAGVTSSSWAVTDLSVFITAFHNIVFDAGNTTNGFWLQRVRVRANAWLSQNGAFIPTHNRFLNVTSWEQLGPVVELNAINFFIEDCDLYGSYNVIDSQRGSFAGKGCPHNTWPNNCHGAHYGVVARNKIYNGGAGHFMNQWNHVVFEHNVQRGVSLMAMGQAVRSECVVV